MSQETGVVPFPVTFNGRRRGTGGSNTWLGVWASGWCLGVGLNGHFHFFHLVICVILEKSKMTPSCREISAVTYPFIFEGRHRAMQAAQHEFGFFSVTLL
jgi:hypothetical protein